MADRIEKKAILTIEAKDKASSEITGLKSNLSTLTKIVKTAFSVTAVVGFARAIQGVTDDLMNMASRAGKVAGVAKGFERNFGDSAKSLERLRTAAQGTIADMDLMTSANKAALLGITNNVDDLAGLMTTARLRAKELGIDATQAFDDIVTGIGRQSPLILDNLGIKIPDAIKTMMEGMSEAEQTQVLLSYAMKDGADLAAQYGDTQLTSAEKVEVLKAKIQNLKDDTLAKLAPALDPVIAKMGDFAQKAADVANELLNGTTPEAKALKWALTDESEGLIPALKRTGDSFNDMMNTITGENKTSMENFTTMLAGWAYLLGKLSDLITGLIDKVTDLIGKYKELNKTNPWNNPVSGVTSLFEKKATGGIVSKRATGGVDSQWTMVGERGPEIVNLPTGSHVYNNEDSKKMMGGGDITININAPTYGINDLKSSILDAVNEATAQQNRLANYNLL